MNPLTRLTFCALALFLAIALGGTGCKEAEDAAKKHVETGAQTMEGASSTEATSMLKQLADGAQYYYNSEHASKDGLSVTTNRYPLSTRLACSAGGKVGQKANPTDTRWNKKPWKPLGFGITKPHQYMYCYNSSRDGRSFAASAEYGDQMFCVTGTKGVISPIREVPLDQDCNW